MRRLWTDAEMQMVRWLYPHVETAKVAGLLGRKVGHVYQKADKLGLSKTPEYLASPAASRLRRGDHVGAAHRFTKGQTPHNKGLRRPGWAPGRMRDTQFRKGERRGAANSNWRPVGTVLTDGEGYRRIKLREGLPGERFTGFGNAGIWPMLQRHTWERANGTIPAGHTIVFKDGNRGNCDLANLELISRADLMRRNSIHTRYPKELVEVIQLNGALKRKLRRNINGEKQDVRPA